MSRLETLLNNVVHSIQQVQPRAYKIPGYSRLHVHKILGYFIMKYCTGNIRLPTKIGLEKNRWGNDIWEYTGNYVDGEGPGWWVPPSVEDGVSGLPPPPQKKKEKNLMFSVGY